MQKFLARIFPNTAGFLNRHRRHIPTAALIFGLIWDSLTLNRPDQLFDNAVLLFYIVLAGAGLLLTLYRRERGRASSTALRAVIQFSFGNLTSGLLVLYSISGTLAGSWVFFVALAALLIGNEVFHTRVERLWFSFSVYYVLVLTYIILVMPIVLGAMSTLVFLLSGVASIVLFTVLGTVAYLLAPGILSRMGFGLVFVLAVILLAFNVLYGTNLIPPVPLAMRDMGIYHDIKRSGSVYEVTYEKPAWYELFRNSDEKIFLSDDTTRAHCFSAVFAPGDLSLPVIHHWEHYDVVAEGWRTHTKIPFSITSGRDEGFRGFTMITPTEEGAWRCSVETQRGALIGRAAFSVVRMPETPDFVTERR